MDYLQYQYSHSSLLQVLKLTIISLVSKPSSSILVRCRDLTFSSQCLFNILNGCLNVIYETCSSFTLCPMANYTESFYGSVGVFGVVTRLRNGRQKSFFEARPG